MGYRSSHALWILLLLGLVAGPASAQEVQVTIRPEAIEVGQRAEISVTLEGATEVDREPRLPPVEGLRFRRAGQQTSFSSVNGRMSRSITFNYVVTAEKVGDYEIGPIEVGINGSTMRSPAVKLTVAAVGQSPGSRPGAPDASRPESAEDGLIFVEASVDDTKVYLGEQVTLRLKFYQAAGFIVRETQLEEPPTTKGFLREEIPPQRTSTARVGGRSYQVTELVYALFPTQTGELEIGPARLRCVVQDRNRRRRDRFDIFGIFEEREVMLRSRPLKVQVDPLPRPQPADFGGGVGHFRMTASIDQTEVRQNEPITLTVRVEGTGNISALDQPNWPEPPSFRSFDPAAPEVSRSKNQDLLGGRKTFKLVLVPETTGQLMIPPPTMSYFRTGRGRYEQLSGDTLFVEVLPGGAQGLTDGVVERLGRDLRTIRNTTRLSQGGGGGLWSSGVFWGLNSLPLAAVVAAWATRRRRHHELSNRDELARRRAPGKLKKGLRQLAGAGGSAEEKLSGLEELWTAFLRDRYGFSLRGRRRDELPTELGAVGCPPAAIQAAIEVLEALDFARFAPGDPTKADELIRNSETVADGLIAAEGGAGAAGAKK